METKYLIIGNSVAGINCIEAIRSQDTKGKIAVISDENILNYSRPLISYYLGKKVNYQKLPFRDKKFYEENGIKLLTSIKAEKINVKNKEVILENNQKVKFNKLLISTGGIPIIPPIEGLESIKEGIFTFTKYEDTQKLIEYIEHNHIKEAVILGAGLIGLKCTEGLLARNIKITIVELADRILANTFDKDASEILEEKLKELNCIVKKENTITKIEGKKGKVKKVILKNGETIETSLLIIAIGVRPNLEIVKDTPINYNRGIVVNEHMETNIKDIYAAGDVAEAKELLTGKNSVIAIWPIAARCGKIAGLNMAGKPTKYEGLFIMNSVELVGIPTISFGITNPPQQEEYEILYKKDKKNKSYRKIIIKDNKIVGAIFLGKIERAGIFAGLIKNKVDISSFKDELLSDNFGFLVLPAEYRKHMVVGEGIEV
jgi:NAD(P)H-nitrite reductase large subunit